MFVLGLLPLIPAAALEPVLAFDAVPGADCGALWGVFAEFGPDAVVALLVDGGAEGPAF